MSNKNFQLEENEILSREDEKVRQMLGSLERIDAPKDFDFRLKARIASAKPQDFQAPSLFPVLRYAAPLALAIVVLAVFVVNGLYSVENNQVAAVNSNVANPTIENVRLPDNSQSNAIVAVDNSQKEEVESPGTTLLYRQKKEANLFSKDSQLAANPGKRRNKIPNSKNDVVNSKDQSSESPSILMPNGFGPVNTYKVKSILSINGMEASFSNKKWTVNSVMRNSIAERSGVKANDIVEAIDEIKISTETITAKDINVKKLTVVRGAERIEINFKNK